MEASVSRAMYRVLEPIHAMIYFAPEAQQEYEALGLAGTAEGYFPARAAVFGIVPWQVVQATFFSFSPLAVQFGLAEAWNKTTPAAVLAARFRAADLALRRMAGAQLVDVQEALALAARAVAACPPAGRPLHAAHAALVPPPEPHLALWHAVTVLREFRGDGHNAVLLAHGLSATQALALHGALQGPAIVAFLEKTRAWSAQERQEAVADLVERGWLADELTPTDAGRTAREEIEADTDVLALPPWEHLGEDGCARLRELLQPMTDSILAAGGIPLPRRRS